MDRLDRMDRVDRVNRMDGLDRMDYFFYEFKVICSVLYTQRCCVCNSAPLLIAYKHSLT